MLRNCDRPEEVQKICGGQAITLSHTSEFVILFCSIHKMNALPENGIFFQMNP
jgi:hypothetical protein